MRIRLGSPRLWFVAAVVAASGLVLGLAAQSAATFDIYLIDVDGGQGVLLVAGGQSMLIDSGGAMDAKGAPTPRDADRIAALAKNIGLKGLDYLVTTHYHTDHAASVPRLASLIPIRTFIDHGEFVSPEIEGATMVGWYREYLKTRATGRHIEARPGERFKLGSVDITVIASRGNSIKKPLRLPRAGKPNPLCSSFQRRPETNTLTGSSKAENAASVALVAEFGEFRFLDVGDRIWNQEADLVCPNNLIGEITAMITPVHGIALSNSPTFIHALRPRVAMWNNGPVKGSREPLDVLRSSPGFEDLWQNHYRLPGPPGMAYGESVAPGGPEGNSPDDYIANLTGKDRPVATLPDGTLAPVAHNDVKAGYIKLSAKRDGSFSVTNSRNGFTKRYATPKLSR